MPDRDPAYVDTLASQLRTRNPGLARAIEDDLARLRQSLAIVTRFIHNPNVALDVRQGLARDLNLPEPTT
ncbi:hypothetical protein [Streptomyces pseudovenezuelae]|uniref:hypothetical protein n=1 Tax=Streptomyces pseudovenezuelae TaxID=67350 RepID=UPI002E81F61A|nr:hypothetical protein [Streptomyces pseudovenezuelae]WUA94519.1 hypothetical protein OHO81_44910 [Streptomyces pseudovenezuelae]